MNSYEITQKWINDIKDFKIPMLDSNGLTRFVIDENLLLNIFANPEPSQGAENSLFFYIPLLNIHLNSEKEQSIFLWYIATQNMCANLPKDMSMAASKESQHIWLNMYLSTENMQLADFERALSLFIQTAKEQKLQLSALDMPNEFMNSASEQIDTSQSSANIIWG